MRNQNRISKAAAVVVIVAYGLFQSIEKKHHIETVNQFAGYDNCIQSADTVQTKDNFIVEYTKSFIESNLQHLISIL